MGRLTRFLDAVDRALRRERLDASLHVRTGDHGRPYVCDNPFCTSPSPDIPTS